MSVIVFVWSNKKSLNPIAILTWWIWFRSCRIGFIQHWHNLIDLILTYFHHRRRMFDRICYFLLQCSDLEQYDFKLYFTNFYFLVLILDPIYEWYLISYLYFFVESYGSTSLFLLLFLKLRRLFFKIVCNKVC